MIAINKNTGASFQIIKISSLYFMDKVLNDPSGTWKKGEIGTHFNKEDCQILIDWETYEKIKDSLSILTKVTQF